MVDERTHLLVAVKDLRAAKTRMSPELGEEHRGALVLAMLDDTLAAALNCSEVAGVHVVTRDEVVAAAVRAVGASVVPDPSGGPDGLNEALRVGELVVHAEHPGVPLAALQGDLPALRSTELAAALAAAAGRRALVPDTAGTGTTLLVAAVGGGLHPAFGPGSAAAHRGSGAAELVGDWPGLRGDVDTLDDLAAALRTGPGAATAALLDRAGQAATVERHDEDGVLLRTDSGTVVRADGAAAARGGWRRLRSGQRVRVHHGADGTVLLLSAPGVQLPG